MSHTFTKGERVMSKTDVCCVTARPHSGITVSERRPFSCFCSSQGSGRFPQFLTLLGRVPCLCCIPVALAGAVGHSQPPVSSRAGPRWLPVSTSLGCGVTGTSGSRGDSLPGGQPRRGVEMAATSCSPAGRPGRWSDGQDVNRTPCVSCQPLCRGSEGTAFK